MNSPDREADGVRATHLLDFEPERPTAGADHPGITATVTNPNPQPDQIAPANRPASITDENREFLDRVVVWPGENNPGWVNLHTHARNDDPKKNGRKPFVVGRPFKTVDAFMGWAAWVETTDNFHDVWFCVSQQSEATVSKTGKPKAVRLSKNATWLKSIWMDIDVRDSGDNYRTDGEALDALLAFMAKVGLPMPSAMIHSGGGLHVYWISDAPLSQEEWLPYAEGLKALVIAEGLKADRSVMTDSARLMRVPDTLNHKYGRKVEVLALGAVYNFDFSLIVP